MYVVVFWSEAIRFFVLLPLEEKGKFYSEAPLCHGRTWTSSNTMVCCANRKEELEATSSSQCCQNTMRTEKKKKDFFNKQLSSANEGIITL
jgi:hypothetical protein